MTGRLAALFAPIVNAAKLAAWPVGSIYMSMIVTSPATLFGGTWVAMQGQFLLGATTSSNLYPPLSMGGEAAHVLKIDEMPLHHHYLPMGQPGTSKYWGPGNPTQQTGLNINETLDEGGNQPHNNMPPYIAVYMWRRTA